MSRRNIYNSARVEGFHRQAAILNKADEMMKRLGLARALVVAGRKIEEYNLPDTRSQAHVEFWQAVARSLENRL